MTLTKSDSQASKECWVDDLVIVDEISHSLSIDILFASSWLACLTSFLDKLQINTCRYSLFISQWRFNQMGSSFKQETSYPPHKQVPVAAAAAKPPEYNVVDGGRTT